MAANYDNSAWFYDRLSKVIYGSAIIKAQVYLLDLVPPDSNVLIVGGGTGWILEEIIKRHSSGLKITYMEISAKMMALSRKRYIGSTQVNYINDAVENVACLSDYDVVITPFLFDNFTEQTLQKVFTHIHYCLKPGGLWLNTDFRLTGRWWQKILLKSMLLFFRLICNIEASRLPDIEKHFEQHGYKALSQKSFFGEFILSTAYQKYQRLTKFNS